MRPGLALFLFLCLGACQGPPTDVAEPLDGRSSEQLGLMRAVSWPGGGRELTIAVRSADGQPLVADLSTTFVPTLSDGSTPGFVVRPAKLAPGYLGILITVPSGQAEVAELERELQAFVASRPAEESIGLFLRRDSVVQLASFTRDRRRLAKALARLLALGSVADAMAMDKAIPQAVADTLAVGGKGPSVMRAVILAGAAPAKIAPSAIPIIPGLANAAARLQLFADSSIYRIALCAGENLDVTMRSSALLGELQLPLPTTPAEDLALPCDVDAIAAGARSYPERLELLFDPGQRSIYDARVAALSTEDFALSVRVGDRGIATATAHLRGKGTLGCERKSYTLRLDGPGRQFFPASHTDEFYLLSMCADDRYVQQYSANQLLTELGLFSLSFRYIEVLLDGEEKGVYLLLEKAREELVDDSSRVRSVMRRRFDAPDDVFEVKYTSGDSRPAATYQRLVEDSALREQHIDVEQYLRFLALMSAFGNGDYIDEIWVIGTETLDDDARTESYYSMMAWDNDDLFSECHYTGKYAFPDPYELAYCAEASIDSLLLSDPQMYERFVDTLETLLTEELLPARFDQAIEATAEAIMPFFDRPGVSAAMHRLIEDNPAAVDPQEAQRDVRARLDGLAQSYRDRRDLLLSRIHSYRLDQQ